MSSMGEECVRGRLHTGKQKRQGVPHGSVFSMEMFILLNITYFSIKDLLMCTEDNQFGQKLVGGKKVDFKCQVIFIEIAA